jgi:hypothetical protein
MNARGASIPADGRRLRLVTDEVFRAMRPDEQGDYGID